MKTVLLIILLLIILAAGGVLLYQAFGGDIFLNPDQNNTQDSVTQADQSGNSNPEEETDSDQVTLQDLQDIQNQDQGSDQSTYSNSDNISYDVTDSANSYDSSQTGKYPSDVTSLPQTALISDEIDMVLLGVMIIFSAAFLIKSGIAYKLGVNFLGLAGGIDFTNFDQSNANFFTKLKYKLFLRRLRNKKN